jgi:peroxiredoxin
VTVEEMAGGRSDQALSLGPLELDVVKRLKVGDVAPDFEIETVAGQPLKLSDFRGKYVLLDFWATWCGPCITELPQRKSVYDRFEGSPRFAMISLSADNDVETAKKCVEENELTWHQGFIGRSSKVQSDYHVSAIPSVFLVGPDGNVVAKNLRDQAIVTELEKVLGFSAASSAASRGE